MRWFDVDPCYVFHPLNAYADGSTVVCDVGRHESMWRTSMDDFPPSYLHRWTFDLATGSVREQQLDDVSHAFPRVDDRVVGLRHRYGWAAAPRDGDGTLRRAVGRREVRPRRPARRERYDLGPHAHVGEFVFVRDDDAAGEDEGWAIGLVYDDTTDRSDLVILDARDAAAEPVARVHLPVRVPFGFHGSWISDAELAPDRARPDAFRSGSRSPRATRIRTETADVERLRPRTSPGRGCRTPSRGR